MEYMNKRGGTIVLEGIEAPKFKIVSIKDALIEALNMEKKVNNVSIKGLHSLPHPKKSYCKRFRIS